MLKESQVGELIKYDVDFCIVGGGIAGLCAALAAARRGVRTLLMQDRPVLGGNASSEIRMCISGSRTLLETGLVEELRLENNYRNPEANFSIWDGVLYGKAICEPNLTLLLNTSCLAVTMDGNRIHSVRGWQLTTYSMHEVHAKFFADCSGDSIVAALSGAEWRIGREATSEFNETIGPEVADHKTMGMSCLFQGRETESVRKFVPMEWAYKYHSEEDLAHRKWHYPGETNFWWIEVGGAGNVLKETEKNRDELLKIAFGVWDHIKNHCTHDTAKWTLEWLGFLPGKRESRRCVGDLLMTQHDVQAGGKFEDIIAYSGWPMDDHHPDGFYYRGEATIYHPAPKIYGLSYRSVYSRNIDNLFFAGRNISVTHAALSGTRVMATCALLGQAVGTAAALAVNKKLATPREVGKHITELQTMLMDDDATLPGLVRKIPELTRQAKLTGPQGCEAILDGVEREEDGKIHSVQLAPGETLTYRWQKPVKWNTLRIIFDSDTGRTRDKSHLNMPRYYALDQKEYQTPNTIVQGFHLEIEDSDGVWHEIYRTDNQYLRLFYLRNKYTAQALRLTVDAVRGTEGKNKIFAFDVQ
jgi:hypothetical protein